MGNKQSDVLTYDEQARIDNYLNNWGYETYLHGHNLNKNQDAFEYAIARNWENTEVDLQGIFLYEFYLFCSNMNLCYIITNYNDVDGLCVTIKRKT